MWDDDRFLDLCGSSERVREAWIRQRRRSRARLGAVGFVVFIAGMVLNDLHRSSGATLMVVGVVTLLTTQQLTMEIRLLRLVGMMNSGNAAK